MRWRPLDLGMDQQEKRDRRLHDTLRARDLLTVAVLIVSLFITYSLWKTASETEQRTLQSAFEFRAREAADQIQQRLLVYEQVLRSTVGLFNASGEVGRQEFRAFVEALRLAENYPGIHGVGYAVLVEPDQLEQHIAQVRAEGYPDYRVWPEGEREVYSSIIYLEPFSGSNLRAFGYDMYSEPNRREAMEHARDSGTAAVTSKIKLVQLSKNEEQAGFLMYLPVYSEDMEQGTNAERRASLDGWVYAPFRMDDFMRGLQTEPASPLDIEVYDGAEIVQEAKMYDADETSDVLKAATGFKKISTIAAANRTWTIAVAAPPAFEERMGTDRPQLILQAGTSISLLLTLLIWLFLDDRARALRAAEQAMQLALYDPLTGLPNRKLLDERLAQALSKARRSHNHVALFFIDLDKFKPINDTYGHAYGDLLLKEVAKRLQGCMRESDTACRLGGDEFVAMFPEIDGATAMKRVANKILNELNKPYEIGSHTFEISASIGVASYPEDGTDEKTLMRKADSAMYVAKRSGRANVKFAQNDAESLAG